MKRKFACFIAIILLIFSNQPYAFAWNALTHYYINQQNSAMYSLQDTFCINGTGPDMLVSVSCINPIPDYGEENVTWADISHCPNPKGLANGTKPFEEKPNISYLMYLVGNASSFPPAAACSEGWGGHISADWVAHNEKLFKIVDKVPGLVLHANAESLYDYYVFLTKHPIPTTYSFNSSLIYKALANYQMIDLHETLQGYKYSDQETRERALEQALPESTIRSCCKRWAGIVVCMQAAYVLKAITDNVDIPEFIDSMEARGVEQNIRLSESSVRDWLIAKTPRGAIPDYSTQVIPFYPFPIAANMDLPGNKAANAFAWAPNWLKYPFQTLAPQPAWAGETIPEQQESEQGIDPDKVTYDFWNKVAEEAESTGTIRYEEDASSGNEGQYCITPRIEDQDAFENILASAIQEQVSDPSSDANRKYAIFCRNFLQDGISNPDALTDTVAPEIDCLSPDNNGITPYHKPAITFRAKDNPTGIGLDPESIDITLDNQPVSKPDYVPELDLFMSQPNEYLPTGEHFLTVRLSDKAGNESELTSRFIIGNVFRQTLFSDTEIVLEGVPIVEGNIYSNGKINTCGSPTVNGDIRTTSEIVKRGNPNIGGLIDQNAEPIPFPEVDLGYYKYLATAEGAFFEGDQRFIVEQDELPKGIVFVEGNVTLLGSSSEKNPENLSTTIVCTGQIRAIGRLALSAAQDNLLLVAKDDIRITGNNDLAGAVYSERGNIRLEGQNIFRSLLSAKDGIVITGCSTIEDCSSSSN